MEFTADLQGFRPSFPFLDINPTVESMNQFTDSFTSNLDPIQTFNTYMPFSTDYSFTHQALAAAEFPGNLEGKFPSIFRQNKQNIVFPVSHGQQYKGEFLESRKRKAMDVSESSSLNSSSLQVSQIGKGKTSSRRGRRDKAKKEEKKLKEVVHVRARRGEATDSHSLAERVRRGKINEKIRCLQEIVPGCSKTMGMAIMLDEIINYVRSLQNQIEFLSMKLTAASAFYDFNAEADDIEIMQKAKAQEAKEMVRMTRDGYGGLSDDHHQTWSL
ncbi:transcription factor BEE 3 [Manihot esculenta]|uniref:Uncharacterized protein n=2 Tax=Manihot esculenta TaxID=3983 RepID=A0ACB7I900_MANES|nr:transcription factor BEE 3 [Manihot esculenta]KAG8661547.1 hypothetical protein MANES_01G011042v8 [Manihot esculenta]